MRKRRKEKSEEIIGSGARDLVQANGRGHRTPAGELAPPTEAWLLRTLAELRREERYQDQPVARPESKRAKKRVS